MERRVRISLFFSSLLLGAALGACRSDAPRPDDNAEAVVVVYTALDRIFSEPILDAFTAETGISVRAVYDTESTKTVGLVNRIRAERNRPRCDVFWNNEILNTLRLKSEDLLDAYTSPRDAFYPPAFHDADGYWHGLAARARVLIVNNDLVPESERPRSIFELAEPRWKGRVALAKPLFGTTASHVACLYARLGPDRAEAFLLSLRKNDVRIVAGNKTAAELVGAGRIAVGFTDTDDAIIEQRGGRPVSIVLPDGDPAGIGTLLLPNTLAIVRGAPHPRAARKLVDFLLRAQVEDRLAAGASAQIPLSRDARARTPFGPVERIQCMRVDFSQAAAQFDRAATFIETQFLE